MSEIWGPIEGPIRRGNATDTTGEHLVPLARVLEIVEGVCRDLEGMPAGFDEGPQAAEDILRLLREEFE